MGDQENAYVSTKAGKYEVCLFLVASRSKLHVIEATVSNKVAQLHPTNITETRLSSDWATDQTELLYGQEYFRVVIILPHKNESGLPTNFASSMNLRSHQDKPAT